MSLIILSVIAYISYFGSRVIMAETSLRNAQIALSKNDGKALYENSLKATSLVPKMATYRLSYAQVNLSLATALSQKESLSDTERSNVSSLISQAVAEGKAALSLSPNNPLVWQTLGRIYQKLINVAEGSDKFAVDAYAQAVTLDPANPTLRIEYGGLLYQLIGLSKDQKEQAALFGRAQSEFQTAIQLKPDYPNAYYNLAKLLEMAKDYENSYIVMQKAISLLGPDNPNLGQANVELEAIKAKVPKATPAPSAKPSATPSPVVEENPETAIQTPAPLPSPIDGGPLDIPVTP
jgi:tetratricopeptide (TPR) repeat protein